MSEIWKDIKGYEGMYQVSNKGNVRSLERVICNPNPHVYKSKVLKPCYDKRYLFVTLTKNGKREHRNIHRLVAETFIPNENNLPQVNHIDENKRNNCAENLEWCSQDYNLHYGNRGKKISQALQNRTTKQSVMYEYEGEKHTLKQWANLYGMSYALFYSRWRKGKRGNELFAGYSKEVGGMNE